MSNNTPTPPGPPGPPAPNLQPGWPPPPPIGGKIWLGIVLGVGVPILCFLLGLQVGSSGSSGSGTFAGFLMMLPFWIMVIFAIVLTVLRDHRRTGIGMWIGLAAIPLIGFGACVVLIFGAG